MSQQDWNNSGGGEEDVQALGAEAGAVPPEPGSGRKLKINSSTLTLLFAFATAVALLYLLGLHNKPKPASATVQARQADMRGRLDDFLKNAKARDDALSLFKDTEKLIKLVGVYFDGEKKPVELQDNPFGHPEAPPMVNNATPEPLVPTETEDPDLRRVSTEFAGLKVQLVMTGQNPAAIVNGKEVQVGSALEEFTVLEIKPDHLVLGWKDKKFTLPAASPQGNQAH